MPAAIRVVLHIFQAIFLILALGGGAVLGLEWLIDLDAVSSADIEELRVAVVLSGIVSVAFSPVLWSIRRRSVEAAPVPPASQSPAPLPQFPAPPQPQFAPPQQSQPQAQQPPQPQQAPQPPQPGQPGQPAAGYGSAPVAGAELPTRLAPGGHSAHGSPAPPTGPSAGAPSDPTEAASPPQWPPAPPP